MFSAAGRFNSGVEKRDVKSSGHNEEMTKISGDALVL